MSKKCRAFLCCCCISTDQTKSSQIHQNPKPPQSSDNHIMDNTGSSHSINIVQNHDFSKGLVSWCSNCCESSVVSAEGNRGFHAVVTNRRETWQGLEQDITSQLSPGLTYSVSACVGISGPLQGPVNISATLKLDHADSTTTYHFVGKSSVTKGRWESVDGSFSLSKVPKRVVFYIEGPPPGVEILVKSVFITCSSPTKTQPTKSPKIAARDEKNIILNPSFDDGLNHWAGRGCNAAIHEAIEDGKILPVSGKFFASATGRSRSWNGLQQDITGRVQRKLLYDVSAVVRIFGNNVCSSNVSMTLHSQTPDSREQYIGIASVQATDKDWVQLQGKFLINNSPSKLVIYFEGPPAGTDILVNSVVVKHAAKIPPLPPPTIDNPGFGVNIVENSNLTNGTTNGWFTLGNCTLNVKEGSPRILPPIARESIGAHEPLSGRYLLVKNRTQTWMGPGQIITEKLKLFVTYQVAAWVRVGSGSNGPQNVNVVLGVDDQWVNGGQVEAGDDMWHEVCGSFRIEKQPSKVMVYIQGPAPGVDLMVAGLHIFAVDREARFEHLKRQTDKIRKRDVTIKVTGTSGSPAPTVIFKQTRSSFPFGSCINRTNIDNEDFVEFFTKNFNWSVFGNEIKWFWTEPQRGKFNYRDADDMLALCNAHNIETRGHCIFWEVDFNVQSWVRSLNNEDLKKAVQNRLTGLMSRYKGKFRHYDVNNEMLHGSFYQDRLGKDIRSDMFKIAKQIDPYATLFVNDYHIEDGHDPNSSPEKYIHQILDLQLQGAPVGGIGVQGHIDYPVGPIVCSALDKLSILGLPIWFTELDVSSVNEHVRADDLEVMLREVFAHAAVEGVMLWGFWELMARENGHLVDAEGAVNEAGKRYVALRKEWMSHGHGRVDEGGEFRFRGFHGTYDVEIVTGSKKVSKAIVVESGDDPLVISIDVLDGCDFD